MLFPPGARPHQTPKTTVKPHQGGMERPALVLFPPRRASWAHPTAARYTPRRPGTPHGGTVHPRRHGTPTGGTAHHGGGAREKPSPRGVGRRLYNDTPLKPAVLRLSVRPLRRAHKARRVGAFESLLFCAVTCAHYAGRTKCGELESLKACCFAPFRAPTTQGAQSAASWSI